jgi:hypothetical protein
MAVALVLALACCTGGMLSSIGRWGRPTGIGLLAAAVLAVIGVRVEVGDEHTSWLLVAVYVVLALLAAGAGAVLMAAAGRANR